MTPVPKGADVVESDDVMSTLFARCYPEMVSLAYLLTRDPGHAEDIAQEAFAALHLRWKFLDDHAKAEGYVRSVVINRSRSRIRSLTRRRRIDADLHQTIPLEASAEDAAGRKAQHAELVSRVRELPRRQREVVVLRYWGGLSEQEIARTLNIAPGSVKTHASRALAALKITAGGLR